MLPNFCQDKLVNRLEKKCKIAKNAKSEIITHPNMPAKQNWQGRPIRVMVYLY